MVAVMSMFITTNLGTSIGEDEHDEVRSLPAMLLLAVVRLWINPAAEAHPGAGAQIQV